MKAPELKKKMKYADPREFNQVHQKCTVRFCVRHMYAKFKDTFKGKSLKDKMWRAASTFYYLIL